MRWVVLAVALFAPFARAEPPVSNPPPTPATNEFPPPPPEKPTPMKGVPKAAFFSLAAGTLAFVVFAGIMTGVVASEPSTQMPTPRAQLEGNLVTVGWIGAVLLLVSTLLVATVTRWNG